MSTKTIKGTNTLPRMIETLKKRMPYVPPAVKKGRTYADFLQYIETHEITNWVEMDTVIGRQGGKVILTLFFTICNFMVGILLDSNIHSIECNAAGTRETHLFFCDAMKSCQKPRVEKNHTLLRDICPKGTSFDQMTQSQLNILFSHMNSTARKQYNGKTPYQLFCLYHGKEMADLLEIREVPADKVIQSKRLLKLLNVTG